jgi:hypothetical protein
LNCGLTNLDTLRKHLLAGSLGAETKFDATLKVVGASVLGAFEKFCNRKFGYVVDDTVTFLGDREMFVLPRYPIVGTPTTETRYASADAWELVDGEPFSFFEKSGVIRFSGPLGDDRLQVRVTWTGGYWFNTLEPEADGYPDTLPFNATELDSGLLGAFLLQCEQAWQVHDRLGSGLVGGDGNQFLNTRLSTLDLIPQVKLTLTEHIRHNL